jgi:hypothetical protein
MKRSAAIALSLVCTIAALGTAVAGEIEVEEMTFCTGVEERAPVGAADEFTGDVGHVCCFTRIIGAQDPTTIYHVWIYDNKEMAKVELAVNSAAWRTWSTKRILDSWTGDWRVEVQTADGTVLKSSGFTVEPAAGS